MRKYLLLSIMPWMMAKAYSDKPQSGYYIGVEVGHASNEFKDSKNTMIKQADASILFGGVFGKEILRKEGFDARIEVELNHNKNRNDTAKDSTSSYSEDFSSTTAFANIYGSLSLGKYESMVKPYALLGIGLSCNTAGDYITDANGGSGSFKAFGASKYSLAWQVGAGLTTYVNKYVNFDLSARYSNRGKAETQSQGTMNGGTSIPTNPVQTTLVGYEITGTFRINI